MEGSRREGEQEDDHGDHGKADAALAQLGGDGDLGMAHGGDHEEDAPQDPADPVESSKNEEEGWGERW